MLIVFNWSISQAYGYEGQNVCTMRINEKKVSGCVGGGYDIESTCLGEWMEEYFKEELHKFSYDHTGKSKFLGLKFYDNKPHCDGSTGWGCMVVILKALNCWLDCVRNESNKKEYLLKRIK